MAYGKIYIDNLREKVTALFDELRADNRLCEKKFIEAFKQKYTEDYSLLQAEWEFEKREFRKNQKGNPKPYPIKPHLILQKIYRDYYFKLIKNPIIKQKKDKEMNTIRAKAGRYGCRIERVGNTKKYNVINKKDTKILYEKQSVKALKNIFFTKDGIKGVMEIQARKGIKSDG